MPISRMFVNDVDLSTFGLWVNIPQGWADGPTADDAITTVPGLAGGMMLTTESRIGTRQLTVEGVLIGATVQEAHDFWDDIKQLLYGPLLEIKFALWPDRFAQARYQGVQWLNVTGIDGGAGFRMTFLMPNPYLLGIQSDVYTLPNGTEVPLTLGTAPSAVSVTFMGAVTTSAMVTYRDAQGTTRGSVGILIPSIAAGDWLSFDGVSYVMTLSKAGVFSNGAPFLDPASALFVADPQDGDFYQGPSLTLVGCDGVATVRKAWL